MTQHDLLVKELNLTDEEFSILADYGLCDTSYPHQTVADWQAQTRREMGEFEMIEMETGEPVFEPGHKRKIMSILNR